MKNHKILFPTDFSENSIRALKDTVRLNKHLGAELIIFHAYHRPYLQNFDQKGQLEELKRGIDRSFASLEDEIPELKSQNHRFHKHLGDFIHSMVELVENESVSLVVMHTNGAEGVGELFGTKTAKIIKSLEVPILVIPSKASLFPMEKLALACDYSQDTPKSKLKFLTELAEIMKLKITAVTLNRDERTMTKEEHENREHLLGNLENHMVDSGFARHPNVTWGLIEYAKSNEHNMIGIISKNYNFMERIFHESLTTDMAFHSPVPLLVLN